MRLMLACDLDNDMNPVLETSARWLASGDHTIDLIYVDDRGAAADYLADDELRQMILEEWNAWRARFEAQLEMLLLRLPERLRGSVRVLRGKPVDTLIKEVADYDGLIVGTHGRTGMARLLMGSVAEQVIRACPKPVLVCHVAG
ncbi:MAG: nucleotide-binding universal stress UspA family protein [Myxococcota bacterium]|jgi:nucleotide-binding universal stress UspA family protein